MISMKRFYALIAALFMTALIALVVRAVSEPKTSNVEIEEPEYTSVVESPYEVELTQSALVDAIMNGDDDVMNFDADLVMRILTAEMGDNENFIGVWAVATMMRNGWTLEHSLMDNISAGWYTDPADYVGEKAKIAFYEVFVFDNPCPEVEDACYFYSTRGGFESQGHETRHELVCEIENYDGSTMRCFR